MSHQYVQPNFAGQHLFIGLDVHKKSWTVCIRFNHMILKTFSMEPSPMKLAEYLRHHYPGGIYHSVYEAGFCGFSIHRKLCEYGKDYLTVLLEELEAARLQLAKTTRRLRGYVNDQSNLKKIVKEFITSVPGIGFVTAITLYTEIIDINRFPDLVRRCVFLNVLRRLRPLFDKFIMQCSSLAFLPHSLWH